MKREPKAKPRRKNPHSEHLAELVAGLDERQNFLQEMESAGMGEKYEAQMKVGIMIRGARVMHRGGWVW